MKWFHAASIAVSRREAILKCWERELRASGCGRTDKFSPTGEKRFRFRQLLR
jgi:hypothetical protein